MSASKPRELPIVKWLVFVIQAILRSVIRENFHAAKMCLYFFGMVLLLSSCVRIPDCEMALPIASCECNEAVQEALISGSFERGDWIHQKWWEDFNDPVLISLIEQGLQENPTLQIAEERLKAAAQVALQKKAALYPELDFDAFDLWAHLSKEGFFRAFGPTIPAAVNDVYIGLSFSYEFDFL